MKRAISYVLTLAFTVLFLTSCTSAKVTQQETDTTGLDYPKTYLNLQSAVSGETEANAKYIAFASAASDEGNTVIQRLFSATAVAEQIHIDKEYSIANSMKKYERTPSKEIEVGTLAENLQSAIDGETYESQTMYPNFLTDSNEEGVPEATLIFTYARDAEASHAALFQDVLNAVNSNTLDNNMLFYLCPVCGKIETAPVGSCSICGVDGALFQQY